jgi:ribonuclease VapC
MIVDSSALVAIFAEEPDSRQLLEAIVGSTRCSISAPTLVETSIVLKKFSSPLVTDLRAFIREAGIDIVAFDEGHADAAEDAYRRFGRGSGSKARLNLGDCFSYAASIVSGRPLLYKGNDFIHTDVMSALP